LEKSSSNVPVAEAQDALDVGLGVLPVDGRQVDRTLTCGLYEFSALRCDLLCLAQPIFEPAGQRTQRDHHHE
jgi:hypothetical protein